MAMELFAYEEVLITVVSEVWW